MSLGPIPLFRICKDCGHHYVDDAGTLSINRKEYLKCPKCGSSFSIEDEEMQKQHEQMIEEKLNKIHLLFKNRKKRKDVLYKHKSV